MFTVLRPQPNLTTGQRSIQEITEFADLQSAIVFASSDIRSVLCLSVFCGVMKIEGVTTASATAEPTCEISIEPKWAYFAVKTRPHLPDAFAMRLCRDQGTVIRAFGYGRDGLTPSQLEAQLDYVRLKYQAIAPEAIGCNEWHIDTGSALQFFLTEVTGLLSNMPIDLKLVTANQSGMFRVARPIKIQVQGV